MFESSRVRQYPSEIVLLSGHILEIGPEAPAGFDDADIGVVRDNAKQLKVRAKSNGFA